MQFAILLWKRHLRPCREERGWRSHTTRECLHNIGRQVWIVRNPDSFGHNLEADIGRIAEQVANFYAFR